MIPGRDLATDLAELGDVIAELRDCIGARVAAPEPPDWCARRGWDGWLLALDPARLERAEARGLAALELADAPESLQALVARVEALTALPEPEVEAAPLRRASARKARQVAALVELARTLGPCARVVDVGAGRGHLTRELARGLGVPALGVERNPERVAAASALDRGEGAAFEVRELGSELAFEAGDLAVGLHACGALGDRLVAAAARDRAPVLLVNCCLQHVGDAGRAPLSAQGRGLGLHLGRRVLGLTNLVAGRRLVAGEAAQVTREREARYGLRLFLAGRGLTLPPGAEMQGLNRRHARRGLEALAQRACARRELAPPTPAELADVAPRAAREFGAIRRLSLPRALLGRALELAVVLDRARCLEEAGHRVRVQAVFARDDSPRNLGILASLA
ncbi:MAG: methyltransferase [Planctomycetota bacterium]